MKGQDLIALRKSLQSKEPLTDAQVALLAKLRRDENVSKRFVAVEKFALREGEEMWDFMMSMMDAVATNRVILADGSLDAWLQGIYNDYVIVQDGVTGRFFKAAWSRAADGTFEFSEPVEVRMEWVPINASTADGGAGVTQAISKRAPVETTYLDVSKSIEKKWGFLPASFTRR